MIKHDELHNDKANKLFELANERLSYNEILKATLPKKLQDAVDLLTVTVGEAKKVLKHDDME